MLNYLIESIQKMFSEQHNAPNEQNFNAHFNMQMSNNLPTSKAATWITLGLSLLSFAVLTMSLVRRIRTHQQRNNQTKKFAVSDDVLNISPPSSDSAAPLKVRIDMSPLELPAASIISEQKPLEMTNIPRALGLPRPKPRCSPISFATTSGLDTPPSSSSSRTNSSSLDSSPQQRPPSAFKPPSPACGPVLSIVMPAPKA